MKAPAWVKSIRRNPKRDTPGAVAFTITADVSQFTSAMREAGVIMSRMGSTVEEAARSTRRLADALQVPVEAVRGAHVTHHPANQPLANMLAGMRAATNRQAKALDVQKAGLEMRWYVKGAMHPAYADPDARDAQFRALAKRGRLGTQHALAFLRGWVEHHPEGTACTCTETDPRYWTTYGGATDPATQWEWDPSCPVHRATPYRGNGSLAGWFSVERELDGWWPGYARYRYVPQRWMLGADQDSLAFRVAVGAGVIPAPSPPLWAGGLS